VTAATAFALAAALHAGFQLTVTVLVYPALVEVPPERWTEAHARHSRRIAPVVGVVYAALLASGVAAVVDGPDALTWVALALTSGALAVTATLAAPLHGRLTPESDDLRARLLTVDRVRCAFAVTGAVAAAAAALT
jgi:hypothetical protein